MGDCVLTTFLFVIHTLHRLYRSNVGGTIKELLDHIHVLDGGGPKLMEIWKCAVYSKCFCSH